MAVLRTLAIALLAAACYAPDVRDCTVSCAAASDCAADQVCGDDRFCAAPEIAGTCSTLVTPDGGVTGSDAPPGDGSPPADAPPDAAPDAMPEPITVQLHIRIDGRGSVSVPAVGTCDGGSGQTDCIYTVVQDVPLSLHAIPKNQWQFQEWDSMACGDEPATCVLTPATATFVKARFRSNDDDDDDIN